METTAICPRFGNGAPTFPQHSCQQMQIIIFLLYRENNQIKLTLTVQATFHFKDDIHVRLEHL